MLQRIIPPYVTLLGEEGDPDLLPTEARRGPRSDTLLHGYAKPLKRLNISEFINRHKCLILLDSCRIHATR